MMETKELILLCNSEPVASVHNAMFTVGNWYGMYELHPTNPDDELLSRVTEYVEFSVAWNRRCKEDFDNPPDPSEFDAYEDMVGRAAWSAKSEDGQVIEIENAPVFFEGQEVTWTVPE